MTTDDKKIRIYKYLDYFTDKQIHFIYELSNLPEYSGYRDLMKLAEIEGTIDTATPIEYYRSIEEIYPNFSSGSMVYDYRTKSFGEMLNINDVIVKRIVGLKS